jgi:hypothetical protein
MKPLNLLHILLLLLVSFRLFSQTNKSPKEILAQPTQEIAAFDTSGFGEYELAIRFPYGSPRILNAADYKSIQSFGKISVEYIYSKYTHSQPGQKELDLARFSTLQRLAPDLFKDPYINWEITVQTAATTAEEARGLFHGFVIRYQPPVTEERKAEIKTELDDLVDCAKKRPPANAPKYPGGPEALKLWLEKNIEFPKAEMPNKGVSKAALVEFLIDTATGKPVQIKVTKGVSSKHNEKIKTMLANLSGWQPGNPNIIFSTLIQFTVGADGKQRIESQPLRGYDPEICKGLKSDSLVMKVMERNKTWKKMLVVEDVTGSMMPYIADLLLWNALKGNLQNTNHFVFFNDGDTKHNLEKVIGSTGGLYHAKPKNVDILEETMIAAIAGGNGEDIPENDIEAVLSGIKSCPECEEVVLISDNDATPRDLELVSQISKPVHVILCGVRYAPNPAHLYIAWKTKGSLHTIREDITKLAEMEEGQTIVVMGKAYKIMDGKFVAVGRM